MAEHLTFNQGVDGSSPSWLTKENRAIARFFAVQWGGEKAGDVDSNHNITFDCTYHVVFCPKYRRKVLVDPMDERLKVLLSEKATDIQAKIVEMEIMPDHVSLLIKCDPQYGIHKVVKQLKGYTSKVLRDEFKSLKSRLPTLWTNSYFVTTVGTVQLDVIKKYIEEQKSR